MDELRFEPLPADTEARLAGFTELAATAVANAQAQAELADELAQRLEGAVTEVAGVLEELKEIARGLHPAVLTDSGLRPALRALARRSGVPVSLDVQVKGRLPEPVEVAAYYAVAEALTNIAKYAGASAAEVEATVSKDVLQVWVRDDGRGGADFGRGVGPGRAQGPDRSARWPDLPPQPARRGHHCADHPAAQRHHQVGMGRLTTGWRACSAPGSCLTPVEES